jgi:hypothetical protein
MMAVWGSITESKTTLLALSEFSETHLVHSNMQVMFPDQDTEANLYIDGAGRHGAVLDELKITADGSEPLAKIRQEVAAYDGLAKLSPSKFGFHALIIMACRHQRVPVPPQYWLYFDASASKDPVKGAEPEDIETSPEVL